MFVNKGKDTALLTLFHLQATDIKLVRAECGGIRMMGTLPKQPEQPFQLKVVLAHDESKITKVEILAFQEDMPLAYYTQQDGQEFYNLEGVEQFVN